MTPTPPNNLNSPTPGPTPATTTLATSTDTDTTTIADTIAYTPDTDTPDTTNRPATHGAPWAALLAASLACFTFALAVLLAQAFPPVSRALSLYTPTGDLSGKSTLAVLTWLLAWRLLHTRWSHRPPRSPAKIAVLSLTLLLLAFASTFPPLFTLLPPR